MHLEGLIILAENNIIWPPCTKRGTKLPTGFNPKLESSMRVGDETFFISMEQKDRVSNPIITLHTAHPKHTIFNLVYYFQNCMCTRHVTYFVV